MPQNPIDRLRREFPGIVIRTTSSANGTALVSECRNTRRPMRVTRKRVPQCGSGQATSVSVVIQSFGWVSRCLAGRSGRSAASE